MSTALAFQLSGTACLIMVELTHVCEAHHLFPWMGWGLKHSVGHYLDLSSAILGLTLLPVGFILQRRLAKPSTITRGAWTKRIRFGERSGVLSAA
jgi:hypothetical protein